MNSDECLRMNSTTALALLRRFATVGVVGAIDNAVAGRDGGGSGTSDAGGVGAVGRSGASSAAIGGTDGTGEVDGETVTSMLCWLASSDITES